MEFVEFNTWDITRAAPGEIISIDVDCVESIEQVLQKNPDGTYRPVSQMTMQTGAVHLLTEAREQVVERLADAVAPPVDGELDEADPATSDATPAAADATPQTA